MTIFGIFRTIRSLYFTGYYKKRLGFIAKTAKFCEPDVCVTPSSIYIYENSFIYEKSKFINKEGKFILKKNSGISQGLTVINGEHLSRKGLLYKDSMNKEKYPELNTEKDILIEEDVIIGANVTLCSGVKIGRGCHIGAGSVVRRSIPPYSVVIGNPSKIVGFRFTPDEIVEHEKLLYTEDERIPIKVLEKNYKKYYYDKLETISDFCSL